MHNFESLDQIVFPLVPQNSHNEYSGKQGVIYTSGITLSFTQNMQLSTLSTTEI